MLKLIKHIPLLAAIIFVFSAQSIKIQSLIPMSEEEEAEYEKIDSTSRTENNRNSSKKDSLTSDDSYSDGDSSKVSEDDKKKPKKSLKDYKPIKDGSLLITPKAPQTVQQKTSSGSSPSSQNLKKKLEQDQASSKMEEEAPTQSYAKKKMVHLKNYKPEEDKSFVAWNIKKLPHFQLYYEKGTEKIINSLSMHLESSFKNMRLTMPVFPYWIDKENPTIYLYATKEKYLTNEFKPMEWSLAIAVPSKKIIVAYANPDYATLKSTLAHELSHLYLQSFFSENKSVPPLWLDEGLATYIGNQEYGGEGFYDSKLKSYPDLNLFKMPEYFSSNLNGKTDEVVSDWYVQAFIIISFLKETGNNIQFKNFFTRLRTGEKEAYLLTNIYRFKNTADFNNKMIEWLAKKSGHGLNSDIFSGFSTGRADAGKKIGTAAGQFRKMSFGTR